MTHLTLTLLERSFGAVSRWAERQRRLAEDRQYLEAAREDPGMMADITCAIARAPAEPPRRSWLDAVAAHLAASHVRPLSARYARVAAKRRIAP